MTFYHIIDPENIGDMSCCPQPYFAEFSGMPVKDFRKYDGGSGIFGGGGMLHPDVDSILETARFAPISIAWGIGSNYHGVKMPVHPNFFNNFSLVGIRDWRSNWDYVPCPSCMAPEFNAPPATQRGEVCVYEHATHPIGSYFPGHPIKNNSEKTLAAVVKFLGEAKAVITNTWHGAYWCLLLDTPVAIFKPFSSRFYSFIGSEVKIDFCDELNWKQVISQACPPRPGYLQRCRDINRLFAKDVQRRI
jgi:hypothetical protein